jgi:hypothetical protein
VSTSAPGVEAIWASCCRSRVSCGFHPVIAAAASSAFGCAVRAQSRQVNGGVRQEKALSACRRASRLCRASGGLRRPWRPGTRTGRCAATSAAAGLSEYQVPWWRSGSRSPLALSLVVVGGSVADCRVGRPHQRIGLETGRPQCGEWSALCPGAGCSGVPGGRWLSQPTLRDGGRPAPGMSGRRVLAGRPSVMSPAVVMPSDRGAVNCP